MSPSKVSVPVTNTVEVEEQIRKELDLGSEVVTIRRNAPAATLYEDGLKERKNNHRLFRCLSCLFGR